MLKSAITALLSFCVLGLSNVSSAAEDTQISLEDFASHFKDQRSCMLGAAVVHEYLYVLKNLPDEGWQSLIEEADVRVDLPVKAELINKLSTDVLLDEIGMARSEILIVGSLIEQKDDYDRINASDYDKNYWNKHFEHLYDRCELKFKEFEYTTEDLEKIQKEVSNGAAMNKQSSWDDFTELYIDFDWTLDAEGNKVPKKQ